MELRLPFIFKWIPSGKILADCNLTVFVLKWRLHLITAGTRESPSRAVRDTRAAVRGTSAWSCQLSTNYTNYNLLLMVEEKVTRTSLKTSTSPTCSQTCRLTSLAWRTSSHQKVRVLVMSEPSPHGVFVSVFLRLSPPPTEKDYCYNLDNSEGVCDLFDVL